MAGREGRLVDIDTGVLRQDRVRVQPTPRAILFLGLGPRAQRLCRFAFGQVSEGDPFIARCLRVAEALAKAGYDPDEPRDEQGRWTTGGAGATVARRIEWYFAEKPVAEHVREMFITDKLPITVIVEPPPW